LTLDEQFERNGLSSEFSFSVASSGQLVSIKASKPEMVIIGPDGQRSHATTLPNLVTNNK
jgi:hypothetical protein